MDAGAHHHAAAIDRGKRLGNKAAHWREDDRRVQRLGLYLLSGVICTLGALIINREWAQKQV